jgi:hypothetical protein
LLSTERECIIRDQMHKLYFIASAAELATLSPFHEGRGNLEAELSGGFSVPRSSPLLCAQSREQRKINDLYDDLLRKSDELQNFVNSSSNRPGEIVAKLLFYRLAHDPAVVPALTKCVELDEKRIGSSDGQGWKPQLGAILKDLSQGSHWSSDIGLRLFGSQEHLFGCLFQYLRAWYYIARSFKGNSPLLVKLKEEVWQSTFSSDLFRYFVLLRTGCDFVASTPVLVVGDTGTGKESVAEVLAYSTYIPFDPKGQHFKSNHASGFKPLNVSAFTSQLLESELFGHRKGAFTGAVRNKDGHLKSRQHETIFLDEVGELSEEVQVKLLRVLQTRKFLPVGADKEEVFDGRLVCATHRDILNTTEDKILRSDFFMRIEGNRIRTPGLRNQLDSCADGAADELRILVKELASDFICGQPPDDDFYGYQRDELINMAADAFSKDTYLVRGFAWPGNFRQLEKMVRQYLIRGRIEETNKPSQVGPAVPKPANAFLSEYNRPMADLKREYANVVLQMAGGMKKEAARRLDIDVRSLDKILKTRAPGPDSAPPAPS